MKEFEKIVNVNCSFCGDEIECPEEILKKIKKYICYKCFTTHDHPDEDEDIYVDIPEDKASETTAASMADKMVAEVFPNIWNEKNHELKIMSKKDLAEEMFGAGVFLGVKKFVDEEDELENDDEHEEDAG